MNTRDVYKRQIQAMLGLLADYDILEIVRTGAVALQRGEDTIAGGIWS